MTYRTDNNKVRRYVKGYGFMSFAKNLGSKYGKKIINNFKKKKKNFMAPFYGWGSTASRLEPLRGGSLLFTTKFPEIPGTHFIDLGRMKG